MSARGYFIHILSGCLVSAVLIAAGLYLRADDATFKSTAARATASVVAHEDRRWRDSNNDERVDSADVYQFTTASGQVAQFKSPISHSQSRRPVGAQAQALYDPNDPTGARLDDDSHQRMATILLWCSPFGVVISAVYFLVWARTRRTAAVRA